MPADTDDLTLRLVIDPTQAKAGLRETTRSMDSFGDRGKKAIQDVQSEIDRMSDRIDKAIKRLDGTTEGVKKQETELKKVTGELERQVGLEKNKREETQRTTRALNQQAQVARMTGAPPVQRGRLGGRFWQRQLLGRRMGASRMGLFAGLAGAAGDGGGLMDFAMGAGMGRIGGARLAGMALGGAGMAAGAAYSGAESFWNRPWELEQAGGGLIAGAGNLARGMTFDPKGLDEKLTEGIIRRAEMVLTNWANRFMFGKPIGAGHLESLQKAIGPREQFFAREEMRMAESPEQRVEIGRRRLERLQGLGELNLTNVIDPTLQRNLIQKEIEKNREIGRQYEEMVKATDQMLKAREKELELVNKQVERREQATRAMSRGQLTELREALGFLEQGVPLNERGLAAIRRMRDPNLTRWAEEQQAEQNASLLAEVEELRRRIHEQRGEPLIEETRDEAQREVEELRQQRIEFEAGRRDAATQQAALLEVMQGTFDDVTQTMSTMTQMLETYRVRMDQTKAEIEQIKDRIERAP